MARPISCFESRSSRMSPISVRQDFMKLLFPILFIASLALASQSGQPASGFPQFDSNNTITLRAGQSVILAGGQTAKVPYGTVVSQPGGGTATLKGQKNTIRAGGGVIVSVPVGASGPADNLVVADIQ